MNLRVDKIPEALPMRRQALPPLQDNTPLWRYMDLGKFTLLLLARKVFIPTLSTLRKDMDPKETLITSYSSDDLPSRLFEATDGKEAERWLAERIERRFPKPDAPASDQTVTSYSWDHFEAARPNILFDEWLDQLSARRAVWCWASPTDLETTVSYESLAMWGLYARTGVAIRTTLARIREAAAASKELKNQEEGIAFWIKYKRQGDAMPYLFTSEGGGLEVKRPFRPYAYKNLGYSYEHEARIAFRVNGEARLAGVTLEMDPHILLKQGEVVVSPYLAEAEADALVSVIKQLANNDPDIVVRQSSERQKMPHERRVPLKTMVAAIARAGAGPDLLAAEDGFPLWIRELWKTAVAAFPAGAASPDQFAEEAGLPVLLREL